ncbi:hypothetical protein PR048_013371, partial [Dryococelus australis]
MCLNLLANVTFLIEPISNSEISFPKTHAQLLERICCDTNIAKCMLSECNDCMSNVKIILFEGGNYDKKLKWKEWKTIENKQILAENCTTLQKIFSQLNSLTHSAYFATCKKSLIILPNKAVRQIGFAENYTLTEQDEIQSHYWSKHQVTIFTCCVWHLDKVYFFAVISDDLRHSKVSVWVFMQSLLIELKKIAPHVGNLFIFSNNCADTHAQMCASQKWTSMLIYNGIFLLLDMKRVKLMEWECLLKELCGKQREVD